MSRATVTYTQAVANLESVLQFCQENDVIKPSYRTQLRALLASLKKSAAIETKFAGRS